MTEATERLLEVDDFNAFLPDTMEVLEKSGEDVEETRPIGGWCSTEDLDRQDEIVVAKGLDFSEFVSWGYFNDNHKQNTSAVLGYPKLAKLVNNRWWTEGNLIKGIGDADKLWEVAKALKKSGAPRKLGFSIEGKILERSPSGNKILRAIVRHVAITNSPVNTACTWDIMAKAFAPLPEVEQAAQKALASNREMRLNGGDVSGIFSRNEDLTFAEAVARVQSMRPSFSKSTCRRIVQYAMCR